MQRGWQEDKAGSGEPLAEALLGAGAGKKAETEPEEAVRLSSKGKKTIITLFKRKVEIQKRRITNQSWQKRIPVSFCSSSLPPPPAPSCGCN